MNLITPARDCTDSELDARIAYFDLRRQPQQQADTLDYSCHTAECATDDDDGPAGDLRSMGGFVAALAWAVGVVGLIALWAVLR